MLQLLQSVREGLQATLDAGQLDSTADRSPHSESPFVYTTAIRSTADLACSLAGISLISKEMGFNRESETVYAPDTLSATFHAQHQCSGVAMAVEVCPPRQTVSIAVSGSDNDETYRLFLEADARLFGNC